MSRCELCLLQKETGWIGVWGGFVREMDKGDVIWIPADVKHWHGATPTTSVAHLAIQETENGSAVTWMEQVTGEQYRQST
jgi:quercetin dioxygenase-like cupin family protein